MMDREKKVEKFGVNRNHALSAALTSNGARPSKCKLLCVMSLSTVSAFALIAVFFRGNGIIDNLKPKYFSKEIAYIFAKVIQTVAAVVLIGTIMPLINAISMWRSVNDGVRIVFLSKDMKDQTKPPKSKTKLGSPSNTPLIPLHPPFTSSNYSRMSGEKSNSSIGSKMHSFSAPSKSQSSPSFYLFPSQTSPGPDLLVGSPWSNKRSPFSKEITTEEKLEQFLAETDERIYESAGKLATPPPTINGFGIASPNTVISSTSNSGTIKSSPLRTVRMSPQFITPPQKGEGDLPPPMSMEELVVAYDRMGIYPQIEQWRDHLRQWFSSVLLNPLLNKIETSHTKVMEAAAKLGITIKVSHVGSDLSNKATTATVSPSRRTNEWRPTYSLDEEGILHQLRATLVQALDASTPRLPTQPSPQQQALIPLFRECIDAIIEHQRLLSLIKGEWVKGLLPQSSVRADYTVQRIRELSEGTCVKNFEYLGSGNIYEKGNKKWTPELPTDSHLLVYLFCAFLEHPKWMLHVDPTASDGTQSSKNPLFLGVLPPKEIFPEKYIAAVSGVPSVLHPGACILAVGKQSPPVFALYWDKKAQFSLQGRTSLWDSILLTCYKIKTGYGGIVRGMHLGSSALALLPVLDLENEDE